MKTEGLQIIRITGTMTDIVLLTGLHARPGKCKKSAPGRHCRLPGAFIL